MTVSPTIPAAMIHNCRYNRASASLLSDRTLAILALGVPMPASNSPRVSPIVSTKASASGSAVPASQRAFTARWVSKTSDLMPTTVG